MRWLIAAIVLGLGMPAICSAADDADLRKWSFNMTYAGVGFGYRLSPHWSAELRGQAAKDVSVGGMRLNYHLNSHWGLYPYLGVEADYTSFEGEVTKGTGYASSVFLGAEYYFGKVWSAVLDVGPAWISITDDDTDQEVRGVEGVINLGVSYHFGRSLSQ